MNSTRVASMWMVAAAALAAPAIVQAQYGGGGGDGGGGPALPESNASSAPRDMSLSPLLEGGYVAVLGNYQRYLDEPIFKKAIGGSLFAGYRSGIYALETGFTYTKDSDIYRISAQFRGLLFPLKILPTAYLMAGIGASNFTEYPVPEPMLPVTSYKRFFSADVTAGVGYILPLRVGNYKFGLRAEAAYRVADRFVERYTDFIRDIPAPGTFRDYNFMLGLQLPLRIVVDQPVEPVAAPEVVPVEAPQDDDQDGVVNGVDRCPDSPAGSVVDETGCPPPPPPPPPKTCKTPGPGEKISLAGCGTGDNIVLRGVNFDTNKATLTRNAKVLLDDVAAELSRYPDIKVQVAGHTDSRGSAALNDGLSKRRAASVLGYLASKGVAADRMTSAGLGANEPIADNATDEGRELNRRVELKIVSGNAVEAAPAAAETAPAEDAPAAQ